MGNAIGALMNLTAESEVAVTTMLAEPARMGLLLEVLPALREESAVCCHAAGTLANLCFGETGRDRLASSGGVRALVETLEASEDDAQTTACCVAFLNATHQHLSTREALLDAGGVNALVACLMSENAEVKAAAAGALLNASASGGCAEAIRDASVDVETANAKSSLSGFDLLLRQLHADQPVIRARAAGALFNCAAFGPDTRLAMLEGHVLDGVVGALRSEGSTDTLGAPKGCPKEMAYRIQANLIGCVLNAALNPTCKSVLLARDAMTPLVAALGSADAMVQSQATTAIAYLSDKAELRPGSPSSTVTSIEDPTAVTKTKLRFHESRPAGGSTGAGASSAAAEVVASAADGAYAATAAPLPPVDDSDDAPGARSKAAVGLMPRAKVSATHDSRSKSARFVQERPETYGRRLTTCVEPDNMEDPYEEVPSPLPSPRYE